jgi:serine/threonine-protein kinase
MKGPELLGGRYEVRHVLGFGGMAEVRDGWDLRLNRAVAIKLLHPGLSSQPDIRERFKVEACAAAALNHPNIVGVYDFGEDDGTPFIVMERLPGDTLGDQIALGPLPEAPVRAALHDVLAALAAAHSAGMLHRDIKPGNILLSPPGSVKVADFGIVKAPRSVHTTTGQIVGTLAYLSPDRIAGMPASVTDDLYAAGVVGYEAIAGRKPFDHDDIAPLARAIVEDEPPPLAELRPDVDAALIEVIERAMTRDPAARFDSAAQMLAALTDHGGQPAMAVPAAVSSVRRPTTRVLMAPSLTSSTAPVPTPAPRGRTWATKVAGSAAVLAAMAVAALAFAFDPSPTVRPTAPEPASISTPVPAPVSVAAVPPPPVVAPSPAPSPVIEQAIQQEVREPINEVGKGGGKGIGNGRGAGKGNDKPK